MVLWHHRPIRHKEDSMATRGVTSLIPPEEWVLPPRTPATAVQSILEDMELGALHQ